MTRPGTAEAGISALVSHLPGPPSPVRRALRSFRRHVGRIFARAYHQWHRSLQLRVIGTTLVISAAVAAILGFFLVQQITTGLLVSQRKLALNEASNGLVSAEAALQGSPRVGASEVLHLTRTLQDGSGPGNVYDVAITGPNGSSLGGIPGLRGILGSRLQGGVPSALSRAVTGEQRQHRSDLLFYEPTQLVSVGSHPATPALAVGAPLPDGVQLYYLFPLTAQMQTLSLVQTTVIAAGAALVVLLVVIVSLVTRWVVLPIRQAAQAARRLSDGELSGRMPVRGTDDLSALAKSFNEMAASLEEKLHELENLSQGQRQFVSDVSHELRTPLTTIRIAADVLFEAKAAFDPAASRSAELLQGQLERFEALLADLLEISRYDANAVTLEPESADVCDLVRRAATDADQLAARLDTRIEYRLPPEPCVAEVDSRRIERVLRNLLDNAVEHGEGRDVVVTVAADRDAIAVAVRDHGVGISPEEQQLVFERFWRSDPARARSTGGTGLGLAIALEDTRLHGGWLQAWGERGRGSVFRLTLPRVAGRELAGSPLPLGSDEVELAVPDAPVADVPHVEVPGAGPGPAFGTVAGVGPVAGVGTVAGVGPVAGAGPVAGVDGPAAPGTVAGGRPGMLGTTVDRAGILGTAAGVRPGPDGDADG